MLEQLKQHYQSRLVTQTEEPDKYFWFTTPQGQPFGIQAQGLSDKELQLLRSLFLKEEESDVKKTPKQSRWFSMLYQNKEETGISPYRFIHVIFNQPLNDETSFYEAADASFAESSAFIIDPNQLGAVLIETDPSDSEAEAYHGFKELLSTDFYVDAKFFIGPWHQSLDQAKTFYFMEKNLFSSIVLRLPPRPVYSAGDLLPHSLLETASTTIKNILHETIGAELENDKELLKSIKVFLESNSNITVASKKLYIHRNSLQYRVDKFIEKTGIDVKQFSNGITVYYAILLLEQE